ncbi:hypothetical protein ET445_01090 [Agromyces protaetiae]|uniref:Uncharacterized protein n=1 Tax=Agromyces protaetiae TaxID=2509455 RepID=A0A4P6F9A6_9MICO|nr:hypothetical protein [Agromyces protaetiae]QAY72136.1 hypothetical protein ET445_01090 [Agromyces protaetiae]
MGRYEDELNQLAGQRWMLPDYESTRNGLDELIASIDTLVGNQEAWRGAAADLARGHLGELRDKFVAIRSGLEAAKRAIDAANSAIDVAVGGELPSSSVPDFWKNTVRIAAAGSTIYFPPLGVIAAEGALGAIEGWLGNSREDAAKAALDGLTADLADPAERLDAATYTIRANSPGDQIWDAPLPEEKLTTDPIDVDVSPTRWNSGSGPYGPGGGPGGYDYVPPTITTPTTYDWEPPTSQPNPIGVPNPTDLPPSTGDRTFRRLPSIRGTRPERARARARAREPALEPAPAPAPGRAPAPTAAAARTASAGRARSSAGASAEAQPSSAVPKRSVSSAAVPAARAASAERSAPAAPEAHRQAVQAVPGDSSVVAHSARAAVR